MVTDTSGATVTSINPLSQQQALRAAGIASTIRASGVVAALEQQKKTEEYFKKLQSEQAASQQQSAAAQKEYENAKSAQEASAREAKDWDYAQNLIFSGKAGASRGDTSTAGKITSTQHKVQYLQQHGYRSAEVMAQARQESQQAKQNTAVSESIFQDLQKRAEEGKVAQQNLQNIITRGYQTPDWAIQSLQQKASEGKRAEGVIGKVGTIVTTTQYPTSVVKEFQQSGVRLSYQPPVVTPEKVVTTKQISAQTIGGPISKIMIKSPEQGRIPQDIVSAVQNQQRENLLKGIGGGSGGGRGSSNQIIFTTQRPLDERQQVKEQWMAQREIAPVSLLAAEKTVEGIKLTDEQRQRLSIKVPTSEDKTRMIYLKSGAAISESIYKDIEKLAKTGDKPAQNLFQSLQRQGARGEYSGSYLEGRPEGRDITGLFVAAGDVFQGIKGSFVGKGLSKVEEGINLITGKTDQQKKEVEILRREEEVQLKKSVQAEQVMQKKVDTFSKNKQEQDNKFAETKLRDQGFSFTKDESGKISVYFDKNNQEKKDKYDKTLDIINKRNEKSGREIQQYSKDLAKNTGIYLTKEAVTVGQKIADESAMKYHPVAYQFNKIQENVAKATTYKLIPEPKFDKATIEKQVPKGTAKFFQATVGGLVPATYLLSERDIRGGTAFTKGLLGGIREKPVTAGLVLGASALTAGTINIATPAIVSAITPIGATGLGLLAGAGYGVSVVGRIAATPGDYTEKYAKAGEITSTELVPGYLGYKLGSFLVPPYNIQKGSIKEVKSEYNLMKSQPFEGRYATQEKVFKTSEGDTFKLQNIIPEKGYQMYEKATQFDYLLQTPGTRFKQIANIFTGKPINEGAYLQKTFTGGLTKELIYLRPEDIITQATGEKGNLLFPTYKRVVTSSPNIQVKWTPKGPELTQFGNIKTYARQPLSGSIITTQPGFSQVSMENLFLGEVGKVNPKLFKGRAMDIYATPTVTEEGPGFNVQGISTSITPSGKVMSVKGIGQYAKGTGIIPEGDINTILVSSAPEGIKVSPDYVTIVSTPKGSGQPKFGILGEKISNILKIQPKETSLVIRTVPGESKLFTGDVAAGFLSRIENTNAGKIETSSGAYQYPKRPGAGGMVEEYTSKIFTPKNIQTTYSTGGDVGTVFNIIPLSKKGAFGPSFGSTSSASDNWLKNIPNVDVSSGIQLLSLPQGVSLNIPKISFAAPSLTSSVYASSTLAPSQTRTKTSPSISLAPSESIVTAPKLSAKSGEIIINRISDGESGGRGYGGSGSLITVPETVKVGENIIQQPIISQPQIQVQYPQISMRTGSKQVTTSPFVFQSGTIIPVGRIDINNDNFGLSVIGGTQGTLLPRKRKKKKVIGPGYEVLIKRRTGKKKGVFVPLKVSLPRFQAEEIARQELLKGPEATAKIIPSKAPVKPSNIVEIPAIRKYFRTGKAGEIIQKERFRIVTPAERKAITAKGLRGRKIRRGPYRKKRSNTNKYIKSLVPGRFR
jgi:hypothetical protein